MYKKKIRRAFLKTSATVAGFATFAAPYIMTFQSSGIALS